MLEAHLCQTQEGTMYKIKASLNYLEQIQKNNKYKRGREKTKPKHIKEAKTKKCVQEKIVYNKCMGSNRNSSGIIFLVGACSRKVLLY